MGKEIVWHFTNSFALGADFCRVLTEFLSSSQNRFDYHANYGVCFDCKLHFTLNSIRCDWWRRQKKSLIFQKSWPQVYFPK